MKDIKITVPDRDASPEDVITVYVVWPHGFNPFVTDYHIEMASFIADADVGERITVDIIEMSRAKYDALPEYEGP